MLNCQEITRLLSESQERSLTFNERISLNMHVIFCSGCRNFGNQMQILRKVARTYAKSSEGERGSATDE